MGSEMKPLKLCLIPILLSAVLVISSTLIGCSSKNELRKYLNDSLYYTGQYTRTMELICGKGMSEVSLDSQADWYNMWKNQLILVKANFETLTPPKEADYFHWLVLRSMDEAITGTTKLADAYKEAAASFSDPDTNKLWQGALDITSALTTWETASQELDKLTSSLSN